MTHSEDSDSPADATATLSSEQALDTVLAELRQNDGSAINSVLFYGSCLRSKNPFDGIVDLYLIVDNYSAFYGNQARAFSNWLLPPNVFYKEFDVGNSTVRVKYNVLSMHDLHDGLSGRWIHPYLWGRFSQPVEILWSRDEELRTSVAADLQQAASTFLARVLPRVPASGSVSELWAHGLRLSYSTELRSEGPDRARELVAHAINHYVSVTEAAAPSLRYALRISGSGMNARYSATVARPTRFGARLSWAIRRLLGKAFSLARLVKALFTFEGGLDYAAWKLERHTGQVIEISDRVRRHPVIFVWPLLWRLYRRGVIR